MGFFKDFKDDVSQAVNEIVDDAIATGGPANNKNGVPDDDAMVDTLEKQAPAKKAAPAPAVKAPVPDPVQQVKSTPVEKPVIQPMSVQAGRFSVEFKGLLSKSSRSASPSTATVLIFP